MEKRDKEKEVVICTGLTEAEFDKAARNKEPHQCYLCKRKEGDKAVCYFANREKYRVQEIELNWLYSVDEFDGKVWRFDYKVCFECAQLLMGQAKHKYITIKRDDKF